MGRDPTKKKVEEEEEPRAVAIKIPPRCTLKCRRRTEMVIVTGSGGLMFLCEVDAKALRKTGVIPKNKIPEKPKKGKKK